MFGEGRASCDNIHPGDLRFMARSMVETRIKQPDALADLVGGIRTSRWTCHLLEIRGQDTVAMDGYFILARSTRVFDEESSLGHD